MRRLFLATLACAVGFIGRAAEPTVKVIDTIGGTERDVWARSTAEFSHDVMQRVFAEAGVKIRYLPQDKHAVNPPKDAEVICSVFRTQRLLRNYLFPMQPLCRMRFALFARAERASELKAKPVVSWPRLKVAFSPVLQGTDGDRDYFFAANALEVIPVSYPTSVGAVEAVIRGEADVLFLYTPVGQQPENLTEILEIGQRNVYFAVRGDLLDLYTRLTRTFRACYVRDIGAFDALRTRHFGTPPPEDRVRVAAYECPGILSLSGDNERLGLLNDGINMLPEKRGREIDWVYSSYAEAVDDVTAGRLDLMADLAFGDGHRGDYIYTGVPLGVPHFVLLTSSDAPYEPNRIRTWRGMQVGVLEGSHTAQVLQKRLDDAGCGVKFVSYARDAELVEAYRSRHVDAIVTTIRPELGKMKTLLSLFPEPLHLCVSHRRADLAEEVDRALRRWTAEEPGLLDYLSGRYNFLMGQDDPGFTFDEVKWLEARHMSGQPVTVAFTPGALTGVESSGELGGFSAYLFEELSRITGLEFQQVPESVAPSSRRQLLDGEIELLAAYPYHAVDLHDQVRAVFTVPVPQYCVRRAKDGERASVRGRFALDRNDTKRINAYARYRVDGHLVPCEGVVDCYRALIDGRADCVLCSMPDGDRAMRELKLWDRVEREVFLPMRYHDDYELVAGPGTAAELVSILRKALHSLDADRIRSFFSQDEHARRDRERAAGEVARLSRDVKIASGIIIGVIGGAALVVLLGFAFGQRRLARGEREARLKVEEALKVRKKFLSAVSHDVRTPLNAILGFSELLASRKGNDAEAQRGLNEIYRGGRALLGLMDDIADVAAGKAVPDVLLPVGRYEHPLVVDDSTVNLAVMRAKLAMLNITDVVVASDGEEALEVLSRDARVDIVLTDLWMSRMGGEDLVRHLRADDRFAKLPVYAVSADGEAMRDFEKKGFTGYMLKPITEDGLREIFGKVRRG